MTGKTIALALLTALIPAGAFAMPPNHTVRFTVPVDISTMPYVNAFTVGCSLTYPEGTVLTPVQSGAAYGRADRDIAGGEFHGSVDIVITAPDGPAPTGYECKLYVTPVDGSGGFMPVDPAKAGYGTPPEHIAASGTVPVTDITGSFGPAKIQTIQKPLHLFHPPPQGH